MNIRKLKIERFGSIPCFEAAFHSDFLVISGTNVETVASAIQFLMGGRLSRREECLLHADMAKLYMEVELDREEIYCVEIKCSAHGEHPQYHAWKPNRQKDCTEEYLRMVRQSEEEEFSNSFSDFKRHSFPHKIKCYKDLEKYYPDGGFGRVTDGIGTTKAFRSYLRDYIRSFKPQRLRGDKDYLLILDDNGAFKVTNGAMSMDDTRCLSESEKILYHYLCFLNLSEFWYGIAQIKDINHVKRPLLVSDFVERIDSAIDITDAILRTRSLGKQTFLMLPCGGMDRIGKIKDAQIICL